MIIDRPEAFKDKPIRPQSGLTEELYNLKDSCMNFDKILDRLITTGMHLEEFSQKRKVCFRTLGVYIDRIIAISVRKDNAGRGKK